MALDPRIALMGRGVEVPDIVVRRGQRAQALRLEQEAAETERALQAQEEQARIIAGRGVIDDGTISALAAVPGGSKVAIDWYNQFGQRKLRQQQGGAAEALGSYRNQQSETEEQKRKFGAELQPNLVRTGRANADIAEMKSGALTPNGDVANRFAQRAAMAERAIAAKQLDDERRGTMTTIEEFAHANPGMNPAQLQEAYSRLGKPTPSPSAARFAQIVNDPNATPEERQAAVGALKTLEQQTKATQRPVAVHVNAGGGGAADDVSLIADAIVNGHQPPTTTGLYGKTAAVRAALERKGYDFTTAERDYKAVQKHLATLNGAQQERLRQAVTFTNDSIDVIDGLYNDWTKKGLNTRFKGINKAALALAKQAGGEAGATAQALEAQINDLVSELGTVYKGGNSSTDESLRLAAENLKGDWNEATFKKALGLIRKNLQIRRNSIETSAPVGVSPNSPYIPSGQRPSMEQQFQESKQSQAPIVQRSKSTGAYRYSMDGGKTWQSGQPK